jgi:hypothetical protein
MKRLLNAYYVESMLNFGDKVIKNIQREGIYSVCGIGV